MFDVDGTLVDSERHGHRVAFNQAFEAFDLPYRWDEDLYGELLRVIGGQRRLHRYLEDQGMGAEERDRLVPELHSRKTAILSEMFESGHLEPRPGAARLLSELASRGCRLAVATTGSRGWVDGLLAALFPNVAFDAVVTGDEVEERKPDPEAFVAALERVGVGAGHAVAVEDSDQGLRSAKGAGLACVVVVNGYTEDHDLADAELVLDGFGEAGDPARVIADRAGTGCEGVLDADVLDRLVGRG